MLDCLPDLRWQRNIKCPLDNLLDIVSTISQHVAQQETSHHYYGVEQCLANASGTQHIFWFWREVGAHAHKATHETLSYDILALGEVDIAATPGEEERELVPIVSRHCIIAPIDAQIRGDAKSGHPASEDVPGGLVLRPCHAEALHLPRAQ